MRGLTIWRAFRCVHSGHSFFSPTPTLHSQELTSRKNTASICRAAHLHTNHFFHKNVCKNCAILEGMLGIRSRKKEEAIPLTKGKFAGRGFSSSALFFPPLSEPQTEAWNSNATFSPPSLPPPCLQNCGEFLFWFLLHTNIFVLWWTAIFSLVLVSEILNATVFLVFLDY